MMSEGRSITACLTPIVRQENLDFQLSKLRQNMYKHIDQKLAEMEARIDQKLADMEARFDEKFNDLINYFNNMQGDVEEADPIEELHQKIHDVKRQIDTLSLVQEGHANQLKFLIQCEQERLDEQLQKQTCARRPLNTGLKIHFTKRPVDESQQWSRKDRAPWKPKPKPWTGGPKTGSSKPSKEEKL